MFKSKALVALVLITYALFVFFVFSENGTLAYFLDALLLPSITVIYLLFIKKKDIFFTVFLLLYSVSDLLGLVFTFFPPTKDKLLASIDYYIGNSMYILAYAILLIGVAKSICFNHILKNFKIHTLVLIVLNVYLVYVLQVIVEPYIGDYNEYYLELVYNCVMLVLLSVTLLNYFYRDNKKALYLFLGSLFIVFSEVIDVAYIYISKRSLLGFLATTLSLVAFYFFYQQNKLIIEEEEEKMRNMFINETSSSNV